MAQSRNVVMFRMSSIIPNTMMPPSSLEPVLSGHTQGCYTSKSSVRLAQSSQESSYSSNRIMRLMTKAIVRTKRRNWMYQKSRFRMGKFLRRNWKCTISSINTCWLSSKPLILSLAESRLTVSVKYSLEREDK